jgi:hypothetical protein
MMATAFHEGRKNGSHFERRGFRFPILGDFIGSTPALGTKITYRKLNVCLVYGFFVMGILILL